MLNLIKSLNKAQKRRVMQALDAVLVPFAMIFAFAALDLPNGLWANMDSYMLLLPYLILAAAGIAVWLGVSDIQVSSYEAASVGLTAVHAILLTIASITISDIAALDLPIGLHMVFGMVFFCLAVASRAVLLQLVLAIYAIRLTVPEF